ncbi:hypothetical protein TEQG_05815 [Trichophyton equinum CBS 127.97]|uniref:Uncharacterized protein n=1 Tax=Trichophyton equinum (strain ATCC MYA-4606 / CBS 127.97) TaxID=559882 RepID=F2PYN7_TRIEC|nr:hypothetical protein TEQG_05815 [Trichophyton equinum CBS 127.97]
MACPGPRTSDMTEQSNDSAVRLCSNRMMLNDADDEEDDHLLRCRCPSPISSCDPPGIIVIVSSSSSSSSSQETKMKLLGSRSSCRFRVCLRLGSSEEEEQQQQQQTARDSRCDDTMPSRYQIRPCSCLAAGRPTLRKRCPSQTNAQQHLQAAGQTGILTPQSKPKSVPAHPGLRGPLFHPPKSNVADHHWFTSYRYSRPQTPTNPALLVDGPNRPADLLPLMGTCSIPSIYGVPGCEGWQAGARKTSRNQWPDTPFRSRRVGVGVGVKGCSSVQGSSLKYKRGRCPSTSSFPPVL